MLRHKELFGGLSIRTGPALKRPAKKDFCFPRKQECWAWTKVLQARQFEGRRPDVLDGIRDIDQQLQENRSLTRVSPLETKIEGLQ